MSENYKYNGKYYHGDERLWAALDVGPRMILQTLGHELALSEQGKPLHGTATREPSAIKIQMAEHLRKLLPPGENDIFNICLMTLENKGLISVLKTQAEQALHPEQHEAHREELDQFGLAQKLYALAISHGQEMAQAHKNRLTSMM